MWESKKREEGYGFDTQETSTKKVWSGNGKTLYIKDFFAIGRGKKTGKLALDIHERKVVFKAVVVYLQRSRRWNSAAAARQIVDILINNYYSDKDNL